MPNGRQARVDLWAFNIADSSAILTFSHQIQDFYVLFAQIHETFKITNSSNLRLNINKRGSFSKFNEIVSVR
jgi:hypothetical protein